MRKIFPYLLILAAAVLGYFLLGDPGAETPEQDMGFEDPKPKAAPTRPEELEAGSLKAHKGTRPPPKPPPMPADPRTLPKGTLIVQPLDPELKPLKDPALRMYVSPKGQVVTRLRTAYDEETGAYRFERVIAGPVRIRVNGDHVLGKIEQAVVRPNRETVYELHLELAGAIKYDVVTYEKTRPKKVLVELFDGAGKPAQGWMAARAPTDMTTPVYVKSKTLGPQGVIFGLRPGPYRVKVTSPESDEWDEQKIVVKARETTEVTLEIRY